MEEPTPDPDDGDQQVVLEELYDENYEPSEAGPCAAPLVPATGAVVSSTTQSQGPVPTPPACPVCRDTGVRQMAGYGHRK